MAQETIIYLRRDCDAVEIPSGLSIFLPKGIPVSIQQVLGGNYTVLASGNLVRIAAADADALGLINAPAPPPPPRVVEENHGTRRPRIAAPPPPRVVEDVPVDHDEVRRQLSSCYDPEIPVDIVELGLVYGCHISPHPEGGHRIEVRMTLTAPGCGMGAILAGEVKEKLERIRGVREVEVKLVFDPPWDRSRMSEAAKLKLGLL